MWYDTFGAGFFIAVSGAFFGFFGLVVRAALKSNCHEVSCCFGLAKCIRGKESEELVLDTPRIKRNESHGFLAPPNSPQHSLGYTTSL